MNPAVLSTQSSIIVTFIASFLIWIMFVALLVLWIIDGRIKKEIVLHALVSSIFAWLISQMIKNLFPTLRPFVINGNPPLTFTIPSDPSFPSGHSAAAFAIAFSVWLHNKRKGLFFIVVALLVSVGRVWGNVHYLFDIVSGAFLGIIVSFVLERLHLFGLIKNKR